MVGNRLVNLIGSKCMKKIQFLCSHKTQLSVSVSCFVTAHELDLLHALASRQNNGDDSP